MINAPHSALKAPTVACLLGRVWRIAEFFHCSTTASHKLKEKQRLLELPEVHELVTDVVTWWNSPLEMLDRFLEQQPAISAALLSVRGSKQDLCTLTEVDIMVAEDVALQPLKAATLSVFAPMHAAPKGDELCPPGLHSD